MENLIPVLVIGGIVGFLLWKSKDKILAKFKKEPESVTTVPNPGISDDEFVARVVASIAPDKVEAPKVEAAPEWEAKAPKGNWSDTGFLKVGKFPAQWPSAQTRYLCNFVANKVYSVSFTKGKAKGLTISPSSNNATSSAVYSFTLTGPGTSVTAKSRPSMANFPIPRNLPDGDYVLAVSADKDAQGIVVLK